MDKEVYNLHQRIETLERVVKALLFTRGNLSNNLIFQYMKGIEDGRSEAANRNTKADSTTENLLSD